MGIAFALVLPGSAFAEEWVELKKCRLVENQSNDGDSFVVECSTPYRGETENRFRLYFVDTAETDANSDFKRERLKEQARFWEKNDGDFALQMGLRASQTVKKWMRREFTVYTQGEYAPSMGAPRYYALVRIKDRWLDEMLVEEGLARIYGQGAELPDGTPAERHWRDLHELERKAKTGQRNGWRGSVVPQPEQETARFESHDAQTQRDAWIYSIRTGKKSLVLPKGTAVRVLEEQGGRLRIRFEYNGAVYEGLCEKNSLN